MRTTLTLDDDVAAKLKAEVRRSGKPFKAVVNDALRRGLFASSSKPEPVRFEVVPRDLGELRAGLSIDNIGDLLEQLEGAAHR